MGHTQDLKGSRICPQCGAGFVCGIAAGDSLPDDVQCWCFDLPAVMPVTADTACLCRDCLTKAIERAQNNRKAQV